MGAPWFGVERVLRTFRYTRAEVNQLPASYKKPAPNIVTCRGWRRVWCERWAAWRRGVRAVVAVGAALNPASAAQLLERLLGWQL